MYFRNPEISTALWEKIKNNTEEKYKGELNCQPLDEYTIFNHLVSLLYKSDDTRVKNRALLQHVYYLSIRNELYITRDFLYMQNVLESTIYSDVSTHILYNRALTQLGLCATRHGEIELAHILLHEICNQGRHRELLAQGLSQSRNLEKTAEQERSEKRRILPQHLHINIDMIESMYTIASMLLIVPMLVESKDNSNQTVISKNFRRMLDYYDKQACHGPPENITRYNNGSYEMLTSRKLARML